MAPPLSDMTSPPVFYYPIRHWGIAQSNTPMVSALKIVGVLLRAIPQPGIAQSNTPMISSSISECIPLRGTSLTWRKSLFTPFSREVYVPSPILLTYGNWHLCNVALLVLAILGHVVPHWYYVIKCASSCAILLHSSINQQSTRLSRTSATRIR